MLADLGHAHWSPTDPVPWGAACRSLTSALGLAASIRQGGDAPGRLAGTPPVTWRLPGSAKGSPSRYTHLLRVNRQDGGWH